MGLRKDDRMVHEGHKTKQKTGMNEMFDVFFSKEKFDTIIEIGTLPGGFALYLAEKSQDMGAKFYTFDIRQANTNLIDKLESFGAKFFKQNVVENKTISKLIQSGGRVLLLNDGIKVPAFKKFAPDLKINDCIFTHDYKHEWQFSDISECINTNNLKVINEEFEEYLWLCCVKGVQ